MADPTVPDPWAFTPTTVDPNAPPLNLGQYLGAPAPAAAPGLVPGLGVPADTLAGAIAAPVPPPLGPDGLPQPVGATGAPALPDVGDHLGVAPDGSAPGAPPVPGLPDLTHEGTHEALPKNADGIAGPRLSPTEMDHDVIPDAIDPRAGMFVEPKTPGDIFKDNGNSEEQQAEYLKQLALNDPGAFEQVSRQHELARQNQIAAETLTASQKNLEDVQANLKMRADAVAKANAQNADIVQRAKAQAAVKIDPQHYMHNRSNGQFLADVIGSIAGGIAAGQVPGGNGVNHYVEGMQQRINADIDAQAKNIANGWKGLEMEKSAVGEQYARSGDLYQATESARLATWEAAKGQIAARAQLFDPKGTAALAAGQAWQAVDQAQTAAAYKVHQDLIKNHIEAGKAGLEAQKFVAEQERAQRDLEEKKREYDKTHALEAWKTSEEVRQHKANEALGTRKQDFAEWKDVQKATAAQASQKGEIGGIVTGLDASGQPKYTDENGDPATLKQADGSSLKLDPKDFEVIAPMISASDRVNQIANKLTREIAEWGGQTDLAKSPHWQIMQGDKQQLLGALHEAYKIKGFRPGTTEFLSEMTGDVDPTSFVRDATAGIQNEKNSINADVDTQLRRIGKYTGPTYAPIDTSVIQPPTKTEVDQEASNAATLTSTERHGAALTLGGNETVRRTAEKVGEASRQKSLDYLDKALSSDDAAVRRNALSSVAELSKNGPTPAVQKRATELWEKHVNDWMNQLDFHGGPKKSEASPGPAAAKASPQSDLIKALRKDLLSTDIEKRNTAVKLLLRLGAVHPSEEAVETGGSSRANEAEGEE